MKAAILVVLILLFCAASSFAWIQSVTTDPPLPTAGVPFTLRVVGYSGGDTCWSLVDHSFAPPEEQEIVVETYYYDCLGRQCDGCNFGSFPFTIESSYEVQQQGSYTIRIVEHRDSVNYPGTSELYFEILVAGPTPSESGSWSMIKSLYR